MADFETSRCSMMGIVVRNRDDGTEYPFDLVETATGEKALASSYNTGVKRSPMISGRHEGVDGEVLAYAEAQMRAAGFMS